jgi:hypothetical protein
VHAPGHTHQRTGRACRDGVAAVSVTGQAARARMALR